MNGLNNNYNMNEETKGTLHPFENPKKCFSLTLLVQLGLAIFALHLAINISESSKKLPEGFKSAIRLSLGSTIRNIYLIVEEDGYEAE